MRNKYSSHPGTAHIKDLLAQIMSGFRRPGTGAVAEVQDLWGKMMGQTITRHARPVALEKGILIIHVDSSTVTQQLRFQVNMIIRRINQQMGHELVSGIRFKISST